MIIFTSTVAYQSNSDRLWSIWYLNLIPFLLCEDGINPISWMFEKWGSSKQTVSIIFPFFRAYLDLWSWRSGPTNRLEKLSSLIDPFKPNWVCFGLWPFSLCIGLLQWDDWFLKLGTPCCQKHHHGGPPWSLCWGVLSIVVHPYEEFCWVNSTLVHPCEGH